MAGTKGIIITATAGSSLTRLTSNATAYPNRWGIMLRAATDATDALFFAFASDASATYPLKAGEVVKIFPEDAANASIIWAKRGGSSDIPIYALVSGAG